MTTAPAPRPLAEGAPARHARAGLRRWAFALLLGLGLVLGAGTADAKLERDQWKQAEAEFKRLFEDRGELEAKQALVELLLTDGESRAWRMLTKALIQECEIWGELVNEMGALAREHNALLAAGGKAGGFTKAQEDAVQEVSRKLGIFEDRVATEQKVLDAVVAAIAKGPEALHKNIIKRAGVAKDWPTRSAAVRIAAMLPDAKENRKFLEKVLLREPDGRVRIAAIEALGEVDGTDEFIIGRLGDKEWGVVLTAVRIIQERKIKRAVPHLINALAVASPRLGKSIGDCLKELTGENFAPYVDVWRRWWNDNKDDFEGSDPKFQKKSGRSDFKMDVYGLRVRSDRVLFILDISGSMNKEAKGETKDPAKTEPAAPTTGGDEGEEAPPPPPRVMSGPKIDFARRQLKLAIQGLPEGATFGIIAFNQASKPWLDGAMQKASDKNKKAAYKWMRTLTPKGSTYTDGALRLAFEKAGVLQTGVDTGYPEVVVDTIVLITDGAPTDTKFSAELMDEKIILDHVKTWNKSKKIVIHTVGIDLDAGVGRKFLKPLAEDNGGVYVEIEK